jgi:serine/threonine protein kinase
MLPQVKASREAIEYFLREIENAKALRHPNVVRVLDSNCVEENFFLALEYCEGGNLEDYVQSQGSCLSLEAALHLFWRILEGLAYAHEAEIPQVTLKDGRIEPGRGLVHRDIKPANIFLTGTGANPVAKIGDYGLAKAFEFAGLSGRTRTGMKLGSPDFMPRQQAMNFKYAKPDVDVWASAACLYYMLTGHTPRKLVPGHDPWRQILKTDPTPIQEWAENIPEALARVIDQALADQSELTFKSAQALKQALEAAL